MKESIKYLMFKYKYIFVAVLFGVMLFFYWHTYQDVVDLIRSSHRTERSMVEENVFDELRHVDTSYKILEKYLNEDMREISLQMRNYYTRHGGIESIDLAYWKKKYPDYDFYVINEELEVVDATLGHDIGLNFSKFPSFSRLLKRRMQGDAFVADRMDASVKTGKIKKYSYIPTPDHKYLLELSIDIQQANPVAKKLDLYSYAKSLIHKHAIVDAIQIFKINEQGTNSGLVTIGKGTSLDTDIAPEVKQTIERVVQSRQPKTITAAPRNKVYKYRPYLSDTEGGELDWWNSYVIRLTYNTAPLKSELAQQRSLFGVKIALLAFAFLLFQATMMYLFRHTEHVASVDPLTQLPNVKHFKMQFRKATLRQAVRSETEKAVVLFVDLDNFKEINDTYGHETGDIVLQNVASVLRSTLRKDDTVVRIGGDEFLVLLPDMASDADISTVVAKISRALQFFLPVNGQSIAIQASIGVSLYPDSGHALDDLIRKADTAMYRAKNAAHADSNWVVYSEG
ncbi:diguanylate cyclase [Desulfohalobium retbaense DSM 5692]|uniref:Diguanylate cyclase n=2 Tax=Desulfohalobium TaxID=45662 RepID=C8X2Y6_DESRD|nr:diguanylate cyclase [Desulfohalobium retbaense DSM 5692]